MNMTMSSAKRAALGGLLVACSLLFSYAETFVPLGNWTGLPGFKLGLANVCIMLACFLLGTIDGLFVVVCKSILVCLLFGSPISFLYSFTGSILAYLFIIFCKHIVKDKISYIGISIGSAALHNIGQICIAALLFKTPAVMWYLEWLLPLSCITGVITGILALSFDKIARKAI